MRADMAKVIVERPRLGHRNFNSFVNGYRLAEARAALADPVQANEFLKHVESAKIVAKIVNYCTNLGVTLDD